MTRATGPLHSVHFRRRREGRTHYGKRLALLKSNQVRLVVRKSNRAILAQFIKFDLGGDKTVAQANSLQLEKFGFKGKCNTPSAYLVGLLAGKLALKAGVKNFIPDFGLHPASNGSVLFAVLKGAVDAGVETSFEEDKLPTKERLTGKHLSAEVQKSFETAKSKLSA